jgi:membrane-bound lytic murein transglycosylase D
MINIKHYILFISYFLIQGCTTLNSSPEKNTSILEINPVLKSTKQILQTQKTPKISHNSTKIIKIINKEADFTDIWSRLATLKQLTTIKNPRIEQQQQWYLKHKKYLIDTSKRAEPFLYFITEEIEKRNMPGEIALLPIIESSFKSNAHSTMKAAGLWQFMPATGHYFGLKQNQWYDGRQDIYHSTLAALTYLQQLHKYYKGDWLLALAAYNAGLGNINKAIKKNRQQGKPTDYWSLSLPKETYKYIPKLLAISQLTDEHKQYNINLFAIKNTPYLQHVDAQSQIELSLVAKMAGLSLTEIYHYNPAFKQWATDPKGPHQFFLPINNVTQFHKQLALLPEKDRIQQYQHKIRSGDTLGGIAKHYNISLSSLKQFNRLKNDKIRAGKYLAIPSPKKKSFITKNNSIHYQVKSGDSLYTISKQFKVSVNDLIRWNRSNLKKYLKPGQKLKVFIEADQAI